MRQIWQNLLRRAKRLAPELRVTLRRGKASEFPAPRDFAYCLFSGARHPMVIVYAPKLARQSSDRISAILRHELAHALAFHAGVPNHSERDTDIIAEKVFGKRIRYDSEDVQSLKHGRSPRPKHLG